jgi:hypothetical protein
MRYLLALPAGLLAAALAFSGGAMSQPRPGTSPLPQGAGQRQVQAACSGCHAITVITSKRYSASKWEQVVDRMVDRGARVGDADFDVVVAYLTRNFGPNGR